MKNILLFSVLIVSSCLAQEPSAEEREIWKPILDKIEAAAGEERTILNEKFDALRNVCKRLLKNDDRGREMATDWATCVANGQVHEGVPFPIVLLALGQPDTVNEFSDGTHQWIYRRGNTLYLYLKKGVVVRWSNYGN